MGVRTWPGYELFGNDCLECFPEGETPLKMIATFGGIHIVTDGAPEVWPPMPQIYMLEQVEGFPCHWTSDNSRYYVVDYFADIMGDSTIGLHHDAYGFFHGQEDDTCETSFANDLVPDGDLKWGCDGVAQIFWRPETNSPSVRGIMAKLNMEPHRNTMFEGFPIDDTHAVAKYCRTKDATNIKIKFET